MIEIIPSINEETWDKVQSYIHKIEGASDWVEIDVCDGTLSERKTWNNPDDLKTLQALGQLRVAVHSMVRHPEKSMEQWIQRGVRRIIVQWEGIQTSGFKRFFPRSYQKKVIAEMQALCKENWVEFGVSISTRTNVNAIAWTLPLCDIVQILSVPIGHSGGGFNQNELQKVYELKTQQGNLHYKIEWDGGVDLDAIDVLQKAGADIATSTNFVFGASDPILALEALRKQAIGIRSY